MPRIPSVLVYVQKDDKVLLLHRHKEPNLGLWIAPGGKVEVDESPQDAAIRELQEETGLVAEDITWRGFITEVSPRDDWQWMLFVFTVRNFDGNLQADLREGSLRWVTLDEYFSTLPIPEADAIFAPEILQGAGMFHAKFVYDADLKLLEWIRY